MTITKVFLHRFNPITSEIEIEYLDTLHSKIRVKVSSSVLINAQELLAKNNGKPVLTLFNQMSKTFTHEQNG